MHSKIAAIFLAVACLSFFSLPTFATAVSSPQIRNGDKCQTLNNVIDNGLFEFKCVKKEVRKFIGVLVPLSRKATYTFTKQEASTAKVMPKINVQTGA